MLELLDNYDWKYAFEYATFDRKDVAEVVHIDDGDNDGGHDWIGVFRLSSGKIGTLRASCDYTEWDCLSSGSSTEHGSLDDAIRFGLSDEERRRFGLTND